MTLINRDGRLLGLVNVVDLLAVLLAIAVVAAGSTLVASSLAGPITAVVALVGLAGLVLASKWYHDVEWAAVADAARDARPSRPSIGGVRNWLTAEPDPEVVVVDLRETLTVGPIIVVVDWIVARLTGLSGDTRG
jgi:hypothetical protein